MNMSFGKFKGESVAWVFLNYPEYFQWMDSNDMQNKKDYQFMLGLKEKLNEMPFSSAMYCSCKNTATRLSLYKGQFNGGYWFCGSCELDSKGANQGYLTGISTYDEFVNGKNNRLSLAYYNAKGVPERKTKSALKYYFGY
ncbi:hypothetical protein ACQKND_22975 [Viridibacillus arvi]|uniref:hypothetical protein n=1 Tax=Viridibacillus arvi TaxID=263475 RepID=UPI003D08A00D